MIIQLIQDYKQKSAELKEKYKILETELIDSKDACDENNKLLQRSRLKYTSVIGYRDTVLIELSKARTQLVETRSEIEEQRGEIKKMSGMINAAEEEMVKLRKKFVIFIDLFSSDQRGYHSHTSQSSKDLTYNLEIQGFELFH